jgi:2-methylcitrate dehydratase PrpD
VSLHHWVSATLHRGSAGVDIMSEATVHDPAIMAFQDRISAVEGPGLNTDAAKMTVHLRDGRSLSVHIEHCQGSADNPMSDAQLAAKFTLLGEDVIGPERTRNLIALCRHLDELEDAGAIAREAA